MHHNREGRHCWFSRCRGWFLLPKWVAVMVMKIHICNVTSITMFQQQSVTIQIKQNPNEPKISPLKLRRGGSRLCCNFKKAQDQRNGKISTQRRYWTTNSPLFSLIFLSAQHFNWTEALVLTQYLYWIRTFLSFTESKVNILNRTLSESIFLMAFAICTFFFHWPKCIWLPLIHPGRNKPFFKSVSR